MLEKGGKKKSIQSLLQVSFVNTVTPVTSGFSCVRVLTPNINLIHLHSHQNEPNSSAADIKPPCWHLRWLPGFNQPAERHLGYRARRISKRHTCHPQPWEGVGLTNPPGLRGPQLGKGQGGFCCPAKPLPYWETALALAKEPGRPFWRASGWKGALLLLSAHGI